MANIDQRVIASFGKEWQRFDQSGVPADELKKNYEAYFQIFPWHRLPSDPVGFDLGCGSGRLARFVADRSKTLHCIDASAEALQVARRNLRDRVNCRFHLASVDAIPLEPGSMDFGYSLGVLHHVPDTLAGLTSCAEKLKPGAPFLVYLYYALENRPWWYRGIWLLSDVIRRAVSRLPTRMIAVFADAVALSVYLPLARTGAIVERAFNLRVDHLPLSGYRNMSFYTMRTDALDRFGTRLEKRFTGAEIRRMMEEAGFRDVVVGEGPPYWCALGYKK
jgi:SAM-dependent methyltransferase